MPGSLLGGGPSGLSNISNLNRKNRIKSERKNSMSDHFSKQLEEKDKGMSLFCE